MVKNPPSHAGDKGSILSQGTKISHATGQLSPHSATRQSPHTTMKTQHGQNKNKQVINEIFVKTEQDCCENTEKEVLGFAELDEGISK